MFIKQNLTRSNMTNGLIRALGGAALYAATGRTIRHNFHKLTQPQNFHFVFAHSDDELALSKLLRIIAKTDMLDASFTLLTNSTQGYEAPFELGEVEIKDRDSFGRLRVNEFNRSLNGMGFNQNYVHSLLDERKIYELLVEKDFTSLHKHLDKARESIIDSIRRNDPEAIFVDDFAGGHIIHDLANYLTCCAVRDIGYTKPVLEFWQYFLNNNGDKPIVVLGDLGYDDKGRTLREETCGKYTPNIPCLGIKKGRMFLSPLDIISILSHKKRVYTSQKKTIDRLMDQRISYGVDAPRFRQIDLDTIDHTHRPSHGVLYENTPWRKRGLKELPGFSHFEKLVRSYEKERVSIKD